MTLNCDMALGLQQNLTLTQQLVMTPQLQQAIKLLQLSRLELAGMIQQEMEENPALEEVVAELPEETERTDKEEASPAQEEPMKEVTIDEKVRDDIDWESYINEYNSTGRVHNGKRSSRGPQLRGIHQPENNPGGTSAMAASHEWPDPHGRADRQPDHWQP